MPFFDLFTATAYVVLSPVFGLRAITLVNVVLFLVSLPLFYRGVARLFDAHVATYSLAFVAFFPTILNLIHQGYPDAAAVSFILITVYYLSELRTDGGVRNGLLTGAFATLSFLMLDVAAAFILLTFLFLVGIRIRDSSVGSLTPVVDADVLSFLSVPSVVAALYVLLGPFAELLSFLFEGGDGFGHGTRPLFIAPETMSFLGKSIRFVQISFFDFWWISGFDFEIGYVRHIESLQELAGQELLFAYFVVWASLAVLGTAILVFGFSRAVRDRSDVRLFVVAWVTLFLGLYLLSNSGWTGAFQTRHVAPIIPAVAILFGIGMSDARLQSRLPTAPPWNVVIAGMIFVVFLTPAVGYGAITTHQKEQHYAKPVSALEEELPEGQTIVYTTNVARNHVILYSHGRLLSSVVTDSSVTKAGFDDRNPEFVPEAILLGDGGDDTHLDGAYVFIHSDCGPFSQFQRTLIELARSDDGRVLFEQTYGASTGVCRFNTTLLHFSERASKAT